MNAKAWWRCPEQLVAGFVLAVILVLPRGAVGAGLTVGAEVSGSTEPVVVGVTVNGTSVADGLLVHRATQVGDERFWVPVEAARAWRVRTAGRAQRDFERKPHLALCGARDACVYDDASALLTVTLGADDLLPLRIAPDLGPAELAPSSTDSGAFLNYDLATWKYGRPGVSAYVEAKAYSAWGHGAARLAGVYTDGRGARSVAQAVWQIDQPEARRSVQIGSIAIPATALGPGLPLTGVRVGSNAGLDPRLPPVLRPSVDGLVDRPVRTDVFVDGTYRQTAQVPYGPYNIEMLPQFTGRSDIEVVTTDLSGVQTRVLIPYYQAPQMLAPGASDWSADAGVLATDTTSPTDARGHPWVVGGSWRYGVNRRLTAQAQALVSPGAARIAVSGDVVTPVLGATGFGVVWQRSPSQGSRAWVGVGHEYATRDFSVSARTEQIVGGCPGLEQSGPLSDRLARACQRSSAVLGTSLGPRWSLSAALEQVREADGRRGQVAALGARLQLGAFSQLALSVQKVAVDDRRAYVGLLTYTRPLGSSYTVQSGIQMRSDAAPSLQWSAQKAPPVDALASTGPRFEAYGGVGSQQSNLGARWSDDAHRFSWRSEVRVDRLGLSASAGVSGAVGYAEGRVFTARRIDDAFVLVDAGLPGLPVLLDNREVTRTDRDGWAVVTGARARQTNQIGIDTSSLPVQFSIPRDQIGVVPGLGSGALARFEPSDGGVSIAVRDASGGRLPAGAAATVAGQRLVTAVTSRSEVFLDRSDRAADVTIVWSGQRCVVRYEPGAEPPEAYRCAP